MEFSLQCIITFFVNEAQMPRLILVSCSSSIKDDSNRNHQHQLTEFSSTAFHLKPNGAPENAQGFPRIGAALERLDFPEPDPAVGNADDVKQNVRVLHCTLAALFIIK
jgi:hypothetical protein